MITEDEPESVKLSLEESFSHYSMPLLFSIVPVFIGYDLIKYYINETHSGMRRPEEMVPILLGSLVLVTILYVIQRRGLKFKTIEVNTSDEEFQAALKETQKKLRWVITKNREDTVKAKKKWDWTFSPGEIITIHRLKDKVLINSICSLERPGTLVFMGRNRRNIATLERELKKASA